MKPVELEVMNRAGDRRMVRLLTEDLAVAYLKGTHATEAVISFTYVDGSPVETAVLKRIFDRVFEEMEKDAGDKDECA